MAKRIYTKIPAIKRFASHLTLDPATGCLNWSVGKRKCKNPYASFTLDDGTKARAHRAAWIFAKGPIPKGLWVLHRCDNPPCCNVDHLFLGTAADNSEDMLRKKRHRTDPPRGEKSVLAKLTDRQVVEIFMASGYQRIIGEHYGVDQRTVSAIKNRVIWRHVTGDLLRGY